MFYSHEILTKREYGVTTVWLVSTIGLRSTNRKISRKDIQAVNVKQACETILKPAAPIALRLQGTLLYGVSRVYSEQCRYVLTDAERVQAQMRAFHNALGCSDKALDPHAGKSRRKELILEDDPEFELRIDLPTLQLDDDGNLVVHQQGSQNSRKTSSQLSPPQLDDSFSSSNRSVLGGFNFSQASFGENPLAEGAFRVGTMTPSKAGDELLPFGDEERELEAFDDWGIEIDADGNVIPAAEEPQLPRLPRPEPAGDAPILQQEEFLPFDAEGDVPMSGGTYSMASDPPVFIQQIQQQQQEREREPEIEREEEEFAMEDEAVFTQASERARRRRRRAVVAPDDQTRVSRHELKSWSTNYLANSEQAIQRRRATTAAEARRNAFNLVFGRGIAGVGLPTGVPGLSHPLSVQFAHQGLQARLLGIFIDQPDGQETRPRSRRRSALEALELDEEDAERRVRPRLSNGPDDQNQDQHHVQSDDAHLLLVDDEANLPPVEVGRRAGSSNHDILSDLPWNRGSSQLAPSSSVRGGSKPPSRRVSASPLHGRGSHINPIGPELEIERFSDQPAIFGSDDGNFALLHSAQGFSSDPVLPPHEESQTTSQMMRRALDLEGRNFLGFIEDVARAKGYLLEDDNDDRQWVDFEHLFEPGDQQRETVAQAFYHVLSLATKNMIKVQQDGHNTNEAFGTIRLGVQLPEAGRAGEGMEGMPGHDDN